MSIDPNKYLSLATALLHDGDFAGAEAAAAVVSDADPTLVEAWVVLALSWTRRKRHDRAVAPYLRALEQRPESVELWADLGECYLEIPDYNGAAAALKQAIELDPNSDSPAGRRARALVGRTKSLLKKA